MGSHWWNFVFSGRSKPLPVRLEWLRPGSRDQIETVVEMCVRIYGRLATRSEYVDALRTGQLSHSAGTPIVVALEDQDRSVGLRHGMFINPRNEADLLTNAENPRNWRQRLWRRGFKREYWRFAVTPL